MMESMRLAMAESSPVKKALVDEFLPHALTSQTLHESTQLIEVAGSP
jgi:hypothetical protein